MRDARPIFLARRGYRRRRFADAARLLPVLGAFLFLLPVLWAAGGQGARSAAGIIYLFAAWALLILLDFLISRRLLRAGGEGEPEDGAATPAEAEATVQGREAG